MCIWFNLFSLTYIHFSLHYMVECYHSLLPNQNTTCLFPLSLIPQPHPTLYSFSKLPWGLSFASEIAALDLAWVTKQWGEGREVKITVFSLIVGAWQVWSSCLNFYEKVICVFLENFMVYLNGSLFTGSLKYRLWSFYLSAPLYLIFINDPCLFIINNPLCLYLARELFVLCISFPEDIFHVEELLVLLRSILCYTVQ